MKVENPNKLELKNKLYEDKKKLMKAYDTAINPVAQAQIKEILDLVNSYIDICIKRNRF